nr:reverse transcriptase domain-containing protein [Tanacetum cinerariifolium]
QNRMDLPRDIPLDRVVVLRYEKRSTSEYQGKVPTEMELELEQTQQGSSYEVSSDYTHFYQLSQSELVGIENVVVCSSLRSLKPKSRFIEFRRCGNFLDKKPRECLAIIESKSKVCYSRNKLVVAKMSMNTSTSDISSDVAELKDMVKALLLDKKSQGQAPATVKAVEESCVTCDGAHSYQNCSATDSNVYRDNIQEFVSQASAVNYNQGNISYRPPMMSNQIKTHGFPPDFLAYVKANDAVMRNMQTQGQNMQNQLTNLTELLTKFVNSNSASTSSSGTLPSNTIANPRSDLKKITTQSGVSYDGPQILPRPSFLPKVVENEPEATNDTVHPTNNESTKDVQPSVVQSESPILTSELVNYPIIEHVASPVSAPRPNQRPSIPYPSRLQDQKLLLLKKLLEKLGDLGKFLFSCNFPRKAKCLALADLGASINLMPLSVWNKLSLPDLTPTCMTLELADHSISHPVGVAEDVYVKVGTFHFSADFVVIDFDADPRVPLILRRSFLKTRRALIHVFEGELTLRVGKEAITFNLDQTSRYSANYNDMTAKRIDVIDMACEEYYQEVLGFYDVITSGNPTPYYDPIVSTTSPTLTPFGNSDFLLEEVDAFLALEDDPTSPEELKICETKSNKSSIDEPSEVGLKDLPRHLKYAFLEGDDKLPVIIVKYLSMEEKTALITVLKSHKRDIAWKLSDIKGIDLEFCTLKILMEEDFEPAVQHQRRVNPKIYDVIKQEVLKLLDSGLIYPISDSPCEKTIFTCPYGTFAYRRMPFGLCNAPGTFQSKTMTEAESNYTTTEKEMLAVVYAFEKFWSYLIMNKSIVYTDHSTVKYLVAKKDSRERLLHWVLLL